MNEAEIAKGRWRRRRRPKPDGTLWDRIQRRFAFAFLAQLAVDYWWLIGLVIVVILAIIIVVAKFSVSGKNVTK